MSNNVNQEHEAAKASMPSLFRRHAPLKLKLFLSRWYWRWVDSRDFFVEIAGRVVTVQNAGGRVDWVWEESNAPERSLSAG